MPKAVATKTRKHKQDAVLAGAIDEAFAAACDVAREGAVGDYLGFVMLDERLGNHLFASTEPGYVGWHWAVTVARPPRARLATICEVDLIPGDGALLAPEWIPWEDRLLPEDISREDVLPYRADDERLDQGYEATGLDADELLGDELGLGRPRVLSARGRAEAIKRWYNSEHGPKPGRLPKATCSTCGFLLKMSGSMRTVFGVCANAWSADDGRVVSLDHSCGSHSETDVPRRETEWPVRPSRINDFQVEASSMPSEEERAVLLAQEDVEKASAPELVETDTANEGAEVEKLGESDADTDAVEGSSRAVRSRANGVLRHRASRKTLARGRKSKRSMRKSS